MLKENLYIKRRSISKQLFCLELFQMETTQHLAIERSIHCRPTDQRLLPKFIDCLSFLSFFSFFSFLPQSNLEQKPKEFQFAVGLFVIIDLLVILRLIKTVRLVIQITQLQKYDYVIQTSKRTNFLTNNMRFQHVQLIVTSLYIFC